MYTLSLQRRFTAWHHLIGKDWGAESEPHTHPYLLEVRLEGTELDEFGYLVDLVEVDGLLDSVVAHYSGADLNALPEFKHLNPSLENFSRLVALDLSRRIRGRGLLHMSIRIWENDTAWASFRIDL